MRKVPLLFKSELFIQWAQAPNPVKTILTCALNWTLENLNSH